MRLSRFTRTTTTALLATIAGLSAIAPPSAATTLPGDSTQIVGGTDAPVGAHPFMVSLQDMTRSVVTPRERHLCGGSLIRSNVVLTAAHCVFNTTRAGQSRPEDLDLVVGRTQLNDTTQGQVRNAASVVIHPEWDGDATHGADVALIRLDVPSTLATVRLPTSLERGRWAAGAVNRLIGWGRDSSGVVPNTLQQVDLTIQTDAFMTSRYGTRYLPAEMLGAGSGNGLGQCRGDSGGPLFFRAADLDPGVTGAAGSQFVQVGAVSFSDKPAGCASEPGVLARVGEGPLRAWIDTMLATPSIRINDTTTPEGFRSNDPSICGGKPFCTFPAQAFFQVRLSAPSIQPVTFRVATANGTATAPADYTAKSLTVTLAPGATVLNFSVNIVRDSLVEPNEQFFANLSSVVNATVADGQGRAVIVNGLESLDA